MSAYLLMLVVYTKAEKQKWIVLPQRDVEFLFHFASLLLLLCNEFVLRNILSERVHLELERRATYGLYLLFHISGTC